MSDTTGSDPLGGSGFTPPVSPTPADEGSVGRPQEFQQSYDSAAAAFGSTEPLKVLRSVWFCFVMLVGSLGIWGLAWVWHTAKEVTPRAGLRSTDSSLSPTWKVVLLFVPIAGFFVVYQCWRDISRLRARAGIGEFSAGGFLTGYIVLSLLPFVSILSIVFPWLVQNKLNEAWRATDSGRATKAQLMRADWITLGIGLAAWVLFLGIVALNP